VWCIEFGFEAKNSFPVPIVVRRLLLSANLCVMEEGCHSLFVVACACHVCFLEGVVWGLRCSCMCVCFYVAPCCICLASAFIVGGVLHLVMLECRFLLGSTTL
jgi:hypothetical protein